MLPAAVWRPISRSRLDPTLRNGGSAAGNEQRVLIGLLAAVVMLIVEMIVFVTRSLKADRVLEAARKVRGNTSDGAKSRM